MSRKAIFEAYSKSSNAYLTHIEDILLEDKAALHKEHDELSSRTSTGYSCPRLRAKIATKSVRLKVIREILDSRLPKFYK